MTIRMPAPILFAIAIAIGSCASGDSITAEQAGEATELVLAEWAAFGRTELHIDRLWIDPSGGSTPTFVCGIAAADRSVGTDSLRFIADLTHDNALVEPPSAVFEGAGPLLADQTMMMLDTTWDDVCAPSDPHRSLIARLTG